MIIETEVLVECDECGETDILKFDGNLPDEAAVLKSLKDDLGWHRGEGEDGRVMICPECAADTGSEEDGGDDD